MSGTSELDEKIATLVARDPQSAYATMLELEMLSDVDDRLYPYVDQFLQMMTSKKTYERTRGLRLLCRQAQWDREDKLDEAIDSILAALDDEKATAVRQALSALEHIVAHKPALHAPIRVKLQSMNPSRYQETMSGLIESDIRRLLDQMR